MALGTMTKVADLHKMASAPAGYLQMTFAGDGSYPTGGTANFEASVRTACGKAVDVLFVIKCADSGIYTPIYDKAADKLFVEDDEGVEVSNGVDLSGTSFKILVAYL